MGFISGAFTIKIRQGPERARVTGSKEKDRKPVDPPPIIQLIVRDDNDPAQNYLQSPYFFMCCNLWGATEDRHIQQDSTAVLAGTLVSSLHRLKDIDNTDGGFFVFGDLSVKVEGDFRLRFSLFEMFKTEVIYIKSMLSDVFTVHAAKSFPGMSESTFLSRSFGDQGVRLRIRKETRTLLKRPAPSSARSEDFPQTFPPPIRHEAPITSAQMQYLPASTFGQTPSKEYIADYQQPPIKRQRTSVTNGTGSYERDTSYNQRSFAQPQSSYNLYTAQSQSLPHNTPDYGQAPLSASTAMPEFSFRYPLPETSAASSPFVSPRSQISSYGPQAQQMVFQQQARYGSQGYPHSQFADVQSTTFPRIAQPVPMNRHSNPVDQLQTNTAIPYTGIPNAMSSINQRRTSAVKDEYLHYSQQIQSPEQMMRGSQTTQGRYSMTNTPTSNLLPPLQSTGPNSQPLVITSPGGYNNYIPPDSRLPSQPGPQQIPHSSHERYTGYQSSNLNLDDRRNLHEPG
ncbi:hypothetical protein MMC15_002912 [Xylographa vitiligo]|nr:hypothetical protein [Xylographa vitiligo]